MFEWFNTDALAQILHNHPYWAIVGSFLTSFIESLAIIGAIMPGAVIMSVIGFLVAVSALEGGSVYLALALGAILGSVASYGAGRYFCDYLRDFSFFRNNPQLLSRSEQFFRHHGGKSIFIGQFLGPMRALIPLTAGMLGMSALRFSLVAVPSAIVWSMLYTIPGFLLGALSVELPPEMMVKFAGASLLALAVLWSAAWLVQFCFMAAWRLLEGWLQRLWENWRRSEHVGSGSWGAKLERWLALDEKGAPSDHRQLLCLSSIVFLALLFAVLLVVMRLPTFLQIEKGFFYFTQSCRTKVLEPIMIGLTVLGDDRFLAVVWLGVWAWMLYRRYFYLAWHWLFMFATAGALVFLLKHLIFSIRPLGIVYGLTTMSFPSGHTVYSLVIFGGFSAIIVRIWPKIREYLWPALFCLIAVVAGSRLYLGAHWIKDIIGGGLIGGVVILATMVSYYRRPVTVSGKGLVAAFGMMLLLAYPIYITMNWSAFNFRYKQVWPIKIASLQHALPTQVFALNDDSCRSRPCFSWRYNRLGKPVEPFNLVVVGDLAQFGRALQSLGWQQETIPSSLRNTLQALFSTSTRNYRYLFTPLHRGKKMELLASKTTQKEDVMLVIQLWPAGIELIDKPYAVWIGNISFHQKQLPLASKDGLLSLFDRPHYLPALRQLSAGASDLAKHGFKLAKGKVTREGWKKRVLDLPDWDGQRLIILQQ